MRLLLDDDALKKIARNSRQICALAAVFIREHRVAESEHPRRRRMQFIPVPFL